MKKFIKITTFALIIFMISALVTVGVYATFDDVTEYQEAIGTLNSIGVIVGRSATIFSPNDNVTRWQMALLMTKLLTGDIDNSKWASSANDIAFTDVTNTTKHYGGSIAYAAKNGIIRGRSDTIFAPEDGITLQDAATMMVRALGYPRTQYDSGYPESYIKKADELGLFAGLTGVSNLDTLTRGETAQLLYNAFTAPMRIGNTIAEDVFAYSDSTIVLTATEDMRINTRVKLAASGKLVFCELKPDGTVDTSTAVSLDKSVFGLDSTNDYLGKSYRVTAVMNYEKILTIAECDTKTITQSSSSDRLTLVSSTATDIKLGNVSYKVVSKYSYNLEENNAPASKEIIVYGVGETYDTSAALAVSDIYGTNAYYTLTVYDDNNDGYPDRAVYRPYSFALYTKTNNDIKLEGKETYNLKSNAVTMTGISAVSGNYIIYSYVPDTSAIDIIKNIPVTEGTVSAYDASSISLKTGTSTASYILGNDLLRGAYPATVKTKLTANPTVSYTDCSAKYVIDGGAVLMLDITDTQNVGTNGYVSQTNCAVVQNVDISAISNNYITLYAYMMDGSPSVMYVRSINGNTVINASTAALISKGDIVEYSVYQYGTNAANNLYDVTIISAKPYVTNPSTTAYDHFIGTKISAIGIGYKTVGSASITYSNLILIGIDTKVIYFDGTNFEPLYVIGNTAYQKQILSGCSMYASYGTSGSTAKLIYVRPKYTSPTGGAISDFTRILYLDQNSINSKSVNNGVATYSYVYDLIEGSYITAEFIAQDYTHTLTPPQVRGYYKAQLSNGKYIITEAAPILADISNTGIVYDGNTALIGLNNTYDNLYYTMNLGGVVYKTNKLDIYKFGPIGQILEENLTNIMNTGITYTVDVFMKPANASGISDGIALIIYPAN